MSNTQMDQVFSYSTNWKEGKVNQMWIQQITPEYQECDHKYVAIAYNPEKNVSMVMSKPRNHYDTLNWVRNFCGSFSILNWFKTKTKMTTLTLQVTEVLFDFDDEDFTPEEQQAVVDDVLGNVFEVEVDDANDDREVADALVEEVTDFAQWCVVSLNFRHVLNTF